MKSIITIGFVLSGALLISMPSSAQVKTNLSSHNLKKEKMSPIENLDKNKEAIKYLYENILNKRKFELLKDIVSDAYTNAQGDKGLTGFQHQLDALIKAFPDAQWKVGELIAEGNKVIVIQKLTGTQTGQFQYISATGKLVTNNGIGIYEFNNGKIITSQVQTDRLGFLQDLGVLPADLTSLTAKKNEKGQMALIDKIFVPKTSIAEVLKQMSIANKFIKTLPGLVSGEAFEQKDPEGNLTLITTAIWENQDYLDSAQKSVHAEFQKQNLNPGEFFKRLNVKIERSVYNKIKK